MPDPSATSLAVWVDRFVSASSAGDARDSLEALVDGLQQPHFPEDDEEPLWHNRELLEALLQILSTGQHKGQLPMEDEGPTLVLRFYLALLPKQKTTSSSSIMVSLLNEPAPGRLVQCLLDVICDAKDETSAYTRVLALQLLQQCGTHAPSLTQSQLLEAPNGLHRLADVLRDENVPEQVRNEWILVAQQTIAQWPSCAKVWVFAELADTLLLMIQREGGLERGNVVVLDALELLETLVSADASLVDLLWQSPIVAPQLAALLDLRKGTEFRNPSAMSTSIAGGASKKPKKEDDLDAILASGSTTKKDEAPTVILPHLTASEEKVLTKVTNIIGLLLPTHETKSTVWKQHKPLGSLLWELALVMPPPPPDAKPVCALPSAAMQQTALEAIALHWNDPKTMERHNGMDRLLYLVCTGGSGNNWDEQLGLSQAALHVLRRTVSVDTAAQVVMHTLAPPMDGDPGPTVLQKLLNTVVENVNLSNEATADEDPKRRRLFLLGSLGAIGVLVEPSSTSREVLLRITSSSSLVDALLQFLEESNDDIGRLAVLRFLASWMVETPAVVQTVLASHASTTTLSSLWASSDKAIATMTGFVLGLAMEYMDGEQEETYGGWTRQNILGLISKRGVSQYTAGLEQLRKMQVPWTVCQLEWKIFWNWYISQVRVIRRRVVQELTAGLDEAEEAVDEEEETEGEAAALLKSSKATIRSLNKLVAQQSQELDELRASLTESKDTLESCKRERDVWKRRVESNPTQLDEMLTEYTRKSAEQEKLMLSLKKELQDSKGNFESALNEKEQARTKLEQEVREWQQREQEAREDRDTMRGEMEGLSSAYASLEAEFHRQTGSTGTAAAAPTSEMSDARPSQQPEGEVSQQDQASLNELAALRAENTRLRSDAQAADEWMAMAVQRMNDIGGQNVALQQQLATLQEQLSTAPGAAVVSVEADRTALESIQSQLQAEQQNRQQLEEILRDLESQKATLEHNLSVLTQENRESSEEMVDVVDLQQKFEQERTLREGLETQLENAQSDVKTAMDSLGAAKSEREDLERTLGNMERDLNIARAEIISLTEERRQTQNRTTHALEVELAATKREREAFETSTETEIESLRTALSSKDEEALALRGELEALRGRLDETMKRVSETEEAAALHQKIESLQQELDTAKTEIRDAEERHLSEIQAKESTIRELQSDTETQARNVPTDATGFFGTGISESASASSDAADFFGAQSAMQDPRDEELARLRSDNEAAQEWMAKAVEHHQMLSDQVAALNTDKAALASEVKELRSMPNQSVPDESQIQALQSQIESLQNELAIAESKLAEASTEKESLSENCSSLESDLELRDRRERELTERVQSLQSELEDARSMLNHDAESIQRNSSEVRSLQAALSGAQSEKIQAKERARELEDELERCQQSLEEMEASRQEAEQALDGLRNEIESAKEENALLLEQTDSDQNTIDGLNAKIAELSGAENTWQERVEALESEKASIEHELAAKTTAVEVAHRELEAISIELSNLREESQSRAVVDDDLVSRAEKAEQELSSLQQQLVQLQNENDRLRREVEAEKSSSTQLAALEAGLKEKADALLDAEDEISQLRADLEDVQRQSEQVVTEWSDRASELEATISELESNLESQQTEASEVISQWSTRCAEFESRAEQLQAEVNELAREKETMAAAVSEASRIEADLRDELAGKQFDLEHAEMLIEQEQEESRLRQEELSAEIDKLKADIASSVGSANELEATKTDYANRKAEWEERESELQATIDQLDATLEEQQEEATSAIAGWESHCQAVEEKNSKLEKELQIALAARDEASSGLKSENGALREELEQEKMSHGELAQEIELLNGQLEEMREESEEIINEWKVRVTELEGNVEELEEILELQRQQATEAISQWEARCTALEKKASAVEAELESFKAEHIELLQAALETKENLVSSASVGPGEPVSRRASEISHVEGASAEIIEALKAQLEDTDKVLADAVESLITERASWRADFEELQACKLELKELQEQLALEAAKNRGSDEAGPRIHLLEEQLAEEREKCTDLHVLLEKERETSATLESELLAAREESESTVSTTQQDLLAAKQEVASLRQQLQTSQLDQSRLVDALETERVKGKDGGSMPHHDFDVLAEEKMVLLQERDDLRLTVAQLEEELREANDTLQACVTDETSEKALEKMTAELRCQLEEMGTQMQRDKEVLNSHKEARIAAEAEIDQIKADLSLLLQSDRSDASDELKRMALRVAGKVQARERQDIDDLRKALERALQELESSKAAERSAVERAESSRLQATAADQELAAAKSDLMFLSQTMEEIREAEATRKAALEYRISALEDDRELLRRLHADELENMRNELAHVSMEKDRILHSLKESEKKNAALVYSTRKEHRDDSATGGSAEAELARLRLERAELLTAVAEEGSRAERRIREAVTAHASSMEADVILERELRVSAESAVEDLKSQVEGLEEELAKVREQVVSPEASEASESTKFVSEKLSSDLKRCQEQAKKLSAEKEALRSQLERSRSESKVQIAELTDKLRTVQARAHRIEREGHFASDVQAEIAKLRGESYVGDRQASGWYVSARDPAHEEEPVPRGQSVSASDAFDYVQKQKIAIQEERAMYLELLAEHDDLLALLAQQDLEKTSLQSALSRVAGNDAVEAAIQEAEENAVKQFGKYVRLAAE